MSLAKADRSLWSPASSGDREAVLRELDAILASPHFCNSKRYPALLRYVVESTLNGRADLKERTLGIEVFGRSADYDTNADTIVRFTAGEVRKRLSLYYHEHDHSHVQISLPAGSYTPEFLVATDVAPEAPHEPLPVLIVDPPVLEARPIPPAVLNYGAASTSAASKSRRWTWVAAIVLLIGCGAYVGSRTIYARNTDPVDRFWAPLVNKDRSTLLCTGGNVFAPDHASGVATASKDIQYPFVSMQIVTAVGQLGGLMQKQGAAYDVQSAISMPLNELRDRPVVLLGGYNNPWTVRLVSGLRFHFSTDPEGNILDRERPEVRWFRDTSRAYGSADDYSLIARFRDTTTGSMVMVLAGLGRNGTEAASNFATDPRYLQMLQDKVGNLGSKNVEVVLKTSVVDGKTGAPSIEAVHTW